MSQNHEVELAKLEFAVADARFKAYVATAALVVVAVVLTIVRAEGLAQRIPMGIAMACWGWFTSGQWVAMWKRRKLQDRIEDTHRARVVRRVADRQRAKDKSAP